LNKKSRTQDKKQFNTKKLIMWAFKEERKRNAKEVFIQTSLSFILSLIILENYKKPEAQGISTLSPSNTHHLKLVTKLPAADRTLTWKF